MRFTRMALLLILGLSVAGPVLAHGGRPVEAGSLQLILELPPPPPKPATADTPVPPGARRLLHGGYVTSLLFAPDGKSVITASADKLVRFWDPKTGKEQRRLTAHASAVLSLAVTRDARLLASGDVEGGVKLWDLARGVEIRELPYHRGDVGHLSFSPDGRFLATTSSGASNEFLRLRTQLDFG